jgi:hypothetical protein
MKKESTKIFFVDRMNKTNKCLTLPLNIEYIMSLSVTK